MCSTPQVDLGPVEAPNSPRNAINYYATSHTLAGDPARVAWQAYCKDLPPPRLTGPGNFKTLPLLKAERQAMAELEAARAEVRVVACETCDL